MKVKMHVKAGGIRFRNHYETIMRNTGKGKGLKVKTRVRAGGIAVNHNETLVPDTPRKR